MKSNGLLKWLLIPVVLLVLFIGIKLVSGNKANTGSYDETPKLTAEEMKALGIEGDTPRDTVATLVGQVKQMRFELQNTLKENTQQKTEIDRLRQRERDIEQRIQNTLDDEKNRLRQERNETASNQQQTRSMIEDLQRRLENIGKTSAQPDIANLPNLPIGLGLEPQEQVQNDQVIWIEPQDAIQQDTRSNKPTISFPTSFRKSDEPESLYAGEKIRHEPYGENSGKTNPRPVYTVPANATLMGSVAMTALIGRIPVDGTVTDPYPFKVLVGPDNLTANGIEIPDVAGAVMSGNASGDWTLSCVRGQIHSITFVFNDGTIRTIPPSTGNSRSNSRNSTNGAGLTGLTGGLGWISDPYGIPCVSGERKSNAQQYLSTQALITAAGAGAASLIKDEDGSFNYANSDGTVGTVGISSNQAAGQILMGGVRDMSRWVNKLYGEAFAAIYVQPGAQVAVHIDEQITIDFDETGRKVDHTLGGSHVHDLD
ncbi:TIGR03752 family integrating conjugative element protein [Saezia sanguinis]|uniref:TIGR03752 family integrating conjugative element protein n=1 Tax=Saezia sanguinis TaxID=1965230 RepID=UPI003070079A